MTDYRSAGKEFQDEFLNSVRRGQAAVVDAIQTWAYVIGSFTPDLPDVSLPFTAKLPRPEEFLATGYEFAEQMLASQRKFAEDLVKATASLWPALEAAPEASEGAPAKPVTTSARKASAAAK